MTTPQNWIEQRRIAIKAWELGKTIMRPNPQRPIPVPRLQPRARAK